MGRSFRVGPQEEGRSFPIRLLKVAGQVQCSVFSFQFSVFSFQTREDLKRAYKAGKGLGINRGERGGTQREIVSVI